MRLYLFPITRSRSLVYCKRAKIVTTASGAKPPIIERVTAKANETWVKWESEKKGWKKTVVGWGNQLFARIAYEEWGLKSVPPLAKNRRAENEEAAKISRNEVDMTKKQARRKAEVDIVFPPRLVREDQVLSMLKHISTSNQGLYRQRMIYSIVAMPFTIPFALIPIVPNLPFFYLVFRAWSYWRALGGSKHIQYLVDQDLITLAPSKVLQRLYDVPAIRTEAMEGLQSSVNALREEKRHQDAEDTSIEELAMTAVSEAPTQPADASDPSTEQLLYPKGHGKIISVALNMPEVEVELERAHDQVSKALKNEQAPPGAVSDGGSKKDQ